MKRLEECRLYGILDLAWVQPSMAASVTAQMIEGGVDILQLRAKKFGPEEIAAFARELRPLTREARVPLIVNDFPHIAAETGAEGVHTGQDDLAVSEARRVAGDGAIIGRSTHSLAQAMVAAADQDVDYLGFGPLFATPTKPDYVPIGLEEIRTVHSLVTKPIFCIGGIRIENLAAVIDAGARRVAIVSAILKAGDIASYCREAKAMLP